MQQTIDAHEALKTRDCAARGCENDADAHSAFCHYCRDLLRAGKRLVCPLAPAAWTPKRRDPRVSAPRTHLTEPELEVLGAAAEGLSNARIAKATSRSIETVKSHKRNLLSVLDAKNTAHAVTIAFRRGLIQ